MERISFQQAPKGYYDAMYKMGEYIKNSTLSPKLASLLRYRASQINGCAYCLDMHFKEAIHAGETTLRLISLSAWPETSYYSEAERAALKYVEILTEISQNEVNDIIYELLTKHFSTHEIADLTMLAVNINAWNRFMKAFKIEPGKYEVGMYN